MAEKTVIDVREFWESAPLFTDESAFPSGSKEFFEEHHSVIVSDCFAGQIDKRIFPEESNKRSILDLGCGPGFWTIELSRNGAIKITAADLTQNAIILTQKRAEIYGIEVNTSIQNAERTTFPDGAFSHVNCQGVIHHTPNTKACIKEIARVLRPNGTALISVYYKNIYLRLWPILKYVGKVFYKLGSRMKGRGREDIFAIGDVNEIVRLYDGNRNPLGKVYSKQEFMDMLTPFFQVEEFFFHLFPIRALPITIPHWIHKILDEKTGFMIYAKCRKPM